MPARQCHHCKEWIQPDEEHDCWTTTEAALTRHLPVDLREAWERIRETAAGLGEQRIYASGRAIMFSRKACYFFVRPKKNFLEVCVFLGRAIKAPQVRRVDSVSKSKLAHIIHVSHRDQVEAPFTDWLQEAYENRGNLSQDGLNRDLATMKQAAKVKGPAPKLDKGIQLKRVRRICQSIAGVVEKTSHGSPTFLSPQRVFVMFVDNHHGDGHVAVWTPAAPGAQEALIAEAPEAYFRPLYVGGAGWVGVELSKVNDEQLGALIREAFRLVTAKKKTTKRAAGGRARI